MTIDTVLTVGMQSTMIGLGLWAAWNMRKVHREANAARQRFEAWNALSAQILSDHGRGRYTSEQTSLLMAELQLASMRDDYTPEEIQGRVQLMRERFAREAADAADDKPKTVN